MNRRALQLLVTPQPARVRWAKRSDEQARRALYEVVLQLIELGEERRP
jgi:hypothetical protein